METTKKPTLHEIISAKGVDEQIASDFGLNVKVKNHVPYRPWDQQNQQKVDDWFYIQDMETFMESPSPMYLGGDGYAMVYCPEGM